MSMKTLEKVVVTPDFRKQGLIVDKVSGSAMVRWLRSRGRRNTATTIHPQSQLEQLMDAMLHPASILIPDASHRERYFLFQKGFDNVKLLEGEYNSNTVYQTIASMASNSDERTINVYFFNLHGNGQILSTMKRRVKDDGGRHVIDPRVLREIMDGNRGVNFIYCNSCLAQAYFSSGLPGKSVYVYSSGKSELNFGEGTGDIVPFWLAYRAASCVFQLPVDFSTFSFKVPAEKMDGIAKFLAFSYLGIKYEDMEHGLVDLGAIRLTDGQLKRVALDHRLGAPVDASQTHQNMGIRYNVQLVF